ncbi:hypothetical protein MesoLjLc_58890 [Mesorhizobium sp. L-8-10]|uniref:hypothetical protein n=1 Tax=Mesorhizobium sp. L-8-10 TaxID=2744523 RepID=UPI001928A77A|nr:hypothetical protein [Mesorhizobium sp. L-8-10]BCH33959.1 hypothetical protein MesoLjLc_58890 [Mesorhizobium sp. L-8-10]
MSISVSPFLRNALIADTLATGATAIIMIAGAGVLGPLLGLPQGLLFWAGVALVPFVALLLVTARRQTVSRLVLIDIIAINVLWVVASFGLLISGSVAPNVLGIAFVTAQALTVALFAELQFVGLRRSAAA